MSKVTLSPALPSLLSLKVDISGTCTITTSMSTSFWSLRLFSSSFNVSTMTVNSPGFPLSHSQSRVSSSPEANGPAVLVSDHNSSPFASMTLASTLNAAWSSDPKFLIMLEKAIVEFSSVALSISMSLTPTSSAAEAARNQSSPRPTKSSRSSELLRNAKVKGDTIIL